MNNPVLTEAALRLSQRSADDPATLSVRLTSRVFQTLHVQLAAADHIEATPGRHPIHTTPIPLSTLTAPVGIEVNWSRPPVGATTISTEVDVDLTIDDGDPAGPFTLTQRLGTLRSDHTAHTLHTIVTPQSLRRTR